MQAGGTGLERAYLQAPMDRGSTEGLGGGEPQGDRALTVHAPDSHLAQHLTDSSQSPFVPRNILQRSRTLPPLKPVTVLSQVRPLSRHVGSFRCVQASGVSNRAAVRAPTAAVSWAHTHWQCGSNNDVSICVSPCVSSFVSPLLPPHPSISPVAGCQQRLPRGTAV